MLFQSASFLIFLPATVAIFWLIPRAWRPHWLVVSSYLFYATWSVPYALLMFILVVANWGIIRAAQDLPARRRAILTAGIAGDLLTLGVFKYLGLVEQTARSAAASLGVPLPIPDLVFVLPLGISFFTFEYVHALGDAGRGPIPVSSFTEWHAFCAFFPTQIAGPIKRLQQFIPQLRALPRPTGADLTHAVELICGGLFKKLVFADTLAVVADAGFADLHGLSQLDAWAALTAFAFQIYWDFSGYTDIARGAALLFGFRVPLNFRQPYLAADVSEFWERWHISLSQWLRDYVFIPLGGSREGVARTLRNLLITFLLGGLWHGAAWHFVAWGGYWGAMLAIYHYLGSIKRRPALPRVAGIAITFLIALVGWALFRLPVTDAATLVTALVVGGNRPAVLPTSKIALTLGVVVAYFGFAALRSAAATRLPAWSPWPALRGVYLAGLLGVAVIAAPVGYRAFIYFQF